MTPDQLKRKLAAILSADVKGYSRLMGEDEEWTLRTLNAYKETMGSLFQQHQGRIVGTAGDSLLAEFASVVAAVQCAVEIQQVLRAKNAVLPETRRMEFRIGINLGDVIEEGDSIYGDGVNIAARLEALAEPGGICISESAFQQIENKIPLHYDYLGEHEVKNIAKPVRVYRARIEPEIASKEKMAFPLPDKPSIAVLPFTNLSGDPKQEFFSDGITEGITTALSKVPKLFVISRNSTFTYKGKPVKVKQVSEDLGVRYVLEGSVQKSGNQVRITAQLIDALTGYHLWAERYDRDLEDLFALQDEVTMKILMALQMKLTEGEQAPTGEKYFRGKQGLDCYLMAWEGSYNLQLMSIEGNNKARRIAEEMVMKWPENPYGYLLMGWVSWMDLLLGSTKSPRESLEKATELAQKALDMDDSLSNAHGLLSFIYSQKREYDKSIVEGERAVALDPNGAAANEWYAHSLHFAGRFEEAIPVMQKAIRLNPIGSSASFQNLGASYGRMGRFEEAVSAFRQAILRSPENIFAHLGLASTYILMGHEEEARAEANEVLRINPEFTLDNYAKGAAFEFPDQSSLDDHIGRLRRAGLK